MASEDLMLVFLFILILAMLLVLVVLIIRQNKLFQIIGHQSDHFNHFQNEVWANLKDQLFKNLEYQERSTSDALLEVHRQMGYLIKSQEELHVLADDIVSLEKILNDKKMRGIFGETELYQLLRNVYGDDPNFYERQYYFANHTIVDCAVKLDGKILSIDSKFPLENYRRMLEENNPELSKNFAKAFRNDILKHIKDIANKYIIKAETLDFALMFIPSYTICDEIYANYTDIIEYSYRMGVYLVSPTTLLGFLTLLKKVYNPYIQSADISKIVDELSRLAQEFKRYDLRFSKLKNDFERLHKDFDEIEITAHKLSKIFLNIEKGEF